MVGLEQARAVFLDFYNPLLEQSQPYGDVVLPGQAASHLMHVTDLVWLKHILGDMDLSDERRAAWADRINRDQEQGTGMYRYPPATNHIDEHGTWQAVAALNMLGHAPAHRLTCVGALLEVDSFRDWCHAYRPPSSHHRFMLAVIAAGSTDVSDRWRSTLCNWYDAAQDRDTGFPFGLRSSSSLSPAFLLSTMRYVLGGAVPRSDRIVETVLGLQDDRGAMTNGELPGYMEMDAAWLLHLLGPGTAIDAGRIDRCLERSMDVLERIIADAPRRARLLEDPHRALAVCGNLSVLWRHFGTCGESPTPFPWAELPFFRAPL